MCDTVDVPVRWREDGIRVARGTNPKEIADRPGGRIGGTLDKLACDVLRTGTGVRYAGGKTARNMVDETSRITFGEIREMVTEMHLQEGRRFRQTCADRGSYTVLSHTVLEPEIRDLGAGTHNAFVSAGWHDPLKNAYPGEFGSFENEDVRFVTSSEFGPFRGAGAVTDSTAHRASAIPPIAARSGSTCIPCWCWRGTPSVSRDGADTKTTIRKSCSPQRRPLPADSPKTVQSMQSSVSPARS